MPRMMQKICITEIDMKRVEKILSHKKFRELVEALERLEADREYCKHDLAHFLDVCRLASLKNRKEEKNISEDLIYAAGLLHDLGRVLQYEEGLDHNIGSARLAKEILPECGFDSEEICQIEEAILGHRQTQTETSNVLADLLYYGDKESRMCGFCKSQDTCYWPEEKKYRPFVG